MQKEIKKRAQLYGLVGVISAIVLGALVYNFGTYPAFQPPTTGLLKTFSSYDELRNYLLTNAKTTGTFQFLGPWDTNVLRGAELLSEDALSKATYSSQVQYSTTNIQVAGVDEADIVKTDGEYIYLVSGNRVLISRAYPPEEAELLSKITFSNDTYPTGMFVSDSKLAVLGSKYAFSARGLGYYDPYFIDIKTFVNVYDISDKTNPFLLKNFTLTGSYFNSRMIGQYVYFVTSQPAYIIYDTVVLPKIYSDGTVREIEASEIHYSNATDNYFVFTTVSALNIQDMTEPTFMTLMLGGTSSMYVSLSNIYITFPDLEDKTSVYRISIDGNKLKDEAHGKVPGHELNQFSMDEYNNHFRIATATWLLNGTSQSNLYVLDMNLATVGSLENLAPSETLDSARFMGNRAYLSTSVVRRDPFFVIDVANPTEPKVLGYLKIPGFNRYLHPYDETHIIGIGRDATNNVKISLFDVSNVTAPIEIDQFAFNGTWSDTPVLSDHKAFLFEKSKNLLAMPATVYLYDPYKVYWYLQGAHIFNITLTGGIQWRGSISHQAQGVNEYDYGYEVNRILYIENVLYTVSDKKIRMNSLADLALINEIPLP